jgi:DNA-directed RNA polymerase specialized sigma24 family protein
VSDEPLWTAVRALPGKQRQAVAYRYVGDLAYADVAAVMGISEAAARRNAADGIKALRRRYPADSPGPHPYEADMSTRHRTHAIC